MTHSLLAKPQPYVKSAECPWVREPNSALEFASVLPYCVGLGLEIGPGGNRFSDTVLAIDNNSTADCDMVWDFDTQGPYPFKDGTFDFVVSSHVLEDAPPHRIAFWFNEWMRLVKTGGHLCILVPDIQGGRYPGIDEKWDEADELVQKGERPLGAPKGNSAHRIEMGKNVLMALLIQYAGTQKCSAEVVQCDTLPKDQMTMDFVVQKIR